MLLVLVNVAAAVHRYHIAMVANVYNRCRSLLDIDGNAATGVHLHMGLQAVMLAQKRHLDRLAEEMCLNKSVKMPLLSQHDRL